MTDFKDIILAVLAILIPAIVAILGYVIHRKTERIKIMESQLSDKKYHAYAGLVDMFFKILKDTKRNNVPNDNLAEQMVDLKKDILLYGSDKVFFAYNNFFDISTNHPGSLKLLNYKIPCSGVISRPAASTSCRSFFITSAGIHLRSTLTVRTRLRLRTMSIGA